MIALLDGLTVEILKWARLSEELDLSISRQEDPAADTNTAPLRERMIDDMRSIGFGESSLVLGSKDFAAL